MAVCHLGKARLEILKKRAPPRAACGDDQGPTLPAGRPSRLGAAALVLDFFDKEEQHNIRTNSENDGNDKTYFIWACYYLGSLPSWQTKARIYKEKIDCKYVFVI